MAPIILGVNDLQAYKYDHDSNRPYAEDVDITPPRLCAHCQQTGIQEEVCAFFSAIQQPIGINTVQDELSVVTACPHCSGITVSHFTRVAKNKYILEHLSFQLKYTTPKIQSGNSFSEYKISPEIKEAFPEFISILQQSISAEEHGLDKLAGMGYRKALEFLVTDYLIFLDIKDAPKDWLQDPKTTLAQKIRYLPNERLITLAKATSYIGNDETHYTRQHPEHDIDSIKMFLKAILSDIDNERIHKEAQRIIDKPKNK